MPKYFVDDAAWRWEVMVARLNMRTGQNTVEDPTDAEAAHLDRYFAGPKARTKKGRIRVLHGESVPTVESVVFYRVSGPDTIDAYFTGPPAE